MSRLSNASGESSVLTVQDAIVRTVDAADAAGRPMKALAQDTRISGSRLYEIYEGRKRLWAEEVPVLVKATGDPLIVSAIAKACGGAFVPLPLVVGVLSDDYRHASDALAQFGQTMQAYATALTDGRITQSESEQIHHEGHEAITAILALMAHADQRSAGWRERKPA